MLVLVLGLSCLSASAEESISNVQSDPAIDFNLPADRARAVQRIRVIENARRAEALAMARQKGWLVRGVTPDNRMFELMHLDEAGNPMYAITHNREAAITTAADLVRNTAPYNLSGDGMIVGLWDGGWVRIDHQEFVSPSRVVHLGSSATYDNHATHVAGTIGAKGHQITAQGMAPNVTLHSYKWDNVISEMNAAAATGVGQTDKLYLSNHSWGYISGWASGNWSGASGPHWWAGTNREDPAYGRYSSDARSWDEVAFNAPYFLIVHSAGNDRNNNAPATGTTYYYRNTSNAWVSKVYDPATDPYSVGFKNGGFNTINHFGNSKNLMVVGAVTEAVNGSARDVSRSTMAAFSGWGPTDDGRIKPDIVANGVGVYSPTAGTTSQYATYQGTSMSSPNVAGSAALLVEQYRNLYPGQDMLAAMLKGLIIHTADDMGRPGPDYSFGWGLMNTKAAADIIIDHHANPEKNRMVEALLNGSTPSQTYTFTWDGVSPIRATLCWADPAAASTTALNSTVSRLVNDLDLKIIAPDGTRHYPYVMPFVGTWTIASMSENATTGVNSTDNVEQVFIANPGQTGQWTVEVTHKGNLTNNQQVFGLVTSGLSAAPLSMEVARGGSSIGVGAADGVSGTAVGSGTQLSYTITNTGGGQLELTTPVTFSGQQNCSVVVNTQPATLVHGGASTNLVTTVTPTAGGTWSFNISIANNDPEKAPYHWFVTGIAGSSATVSFTPVADTYIDSLNAEFNFGSAGDIRLHNQSGGNPSSRLYMRGLMRFDLSSIPPGTTIESATLGFVQDNTVSGSISIYDATGTWTEGGATWSNSNSLFGGTIYGTANLPGIAGGTVPSISLNASGLSKVQSWVNTPSGNHGFGITATDSGNSQNWMSLRSSNHATSAHHPRLTLTYGGGGSVQAPLMIVSGNDGVISNGGIDSIAESQADVGTQLTYPIQNLGNANLTLTTPVTATAVSNCSITVNTQPSSPVAPSGSANLVLAVTPSGAGAWSATVSIANNDADKNPYTWTISGMASKRQATLALNGLNQTYDGTPRVVTASTTPAGLSYSVTYNGQSEPPVNAGSCEVNANITDPSYEGSATGTLVVAKAAQTIIFAPLDPVGNDQEPFALTATASSGLTVSYTSSNPSVASVSGNTVTVIGTGTTIITAAQSGDANHLPATSVDQELVVVPVVPTANPGGPYKVLIGQALVLDGSVSSPSFGESIAAYDWDLNNDGTFGDVTGATPAAIPFDDLVNLWGMTQGLNTIQIRVTDSAAKTATAATTVELMVSLQWDANGTTAGQTNGGGAWLGNNLWWDGATNVNWVPGSNAIFGGPSTAGGSVTLASPTTVNAITFNTFTGTYTLGTSGQAITLNDGINKGSSSAAVTFASPITLGGDQTWTNNSTGAITTANGTNLITNNGYQLTIDGTGTTNFGVINNSSATISGSGALVKNGSGRMNVGGVNSDLTGPVTINGGVMQVHNNNEPMGSGNLTLNGGVMSFYWGATYTRTLGAGDNQVRISGGESGFAGAGSSGPTINLGSSVIWGAGGEGAATGFFNPDKFVLGDSGTGNAAVTTFSSAIDLNAATRTILVPVGNNAGRNRTTISGRIFNSTGTAGLIKEGDGWLFLTHGYASTNVGWNGTTTISEGMLDFTNANMANIGGGSGRNISIAEGAGVRFNALSNALLNRMVNTTAEITVMTGTTSNNLDFSGNTGANLSNAFLGNWAGNGAKMEYSGTITPASDNYRLGSPRYNAGLLGITNTSPMTGSQGLIIGGGSVELVGQKTFTGDTVIRNGARLGLAAIADGGGVALALQNSALDTGTSANTGTIWFERGDATGAITGSVSTASAVFGGLKGSRNLAAVYSTTTGANNSAATAFADIPGFTLNPGSGKTHDYSGAIADFATGTTITKTGEGTQILSGANTYTGATTISSGKLVINGSLSNVNAPLTVGPGATLGGVGTVGRDVTLEDGGKLEFNLDSAAGSHIPLSIYAGRSFAFSGASELTIATGGGASPGTYVLVTGGNTIIGSAPATLNLPSGWSATTEISGNSLLLHVTSTGTGPGPVASFAISGMPAQATVGIPITGITITARDAADKIATSFTGTVAYGGTAGITGNSGNFVDGVLTGVSVTPTLAGTARTFTVTDGQGSGGSASFVVLSAYEAWSGGSAFGEDDNGDGVSNIVAWVLGANDPTTNASALLPTLAESDETGFTTFTYRRSRAAHADPGTSIQVEYSGTLTDDWITATHDGNDIIINETADGFGPGIDRVEVKIRESFASDNRLFLQLSVVPNQ